LALKGGLGRVIQPPWLMYVCDKSFSFVRPSRVHSGSGLLGFPDEVYPPATSGP
jgi:hypothetical protein